MAEDIVERITPLIVRIGLPVGADGARTAGVDRDLQPLRWQR